MRRFILILLPLLLGALSRHNPVDLVVLSKWVRHWQTGHGEQTATLCMSALTADEVAEQRAQVPERVAAMLARGASVVVVDLDLSEPHPSDAALKELALGGRVIFGREPGQPALAEPSGRADMDRSWGLGVVRAAPPPREQPLSLVALEAHLGRPVELGEHDVIPFMPYLIPFLHWEDQGDWHLAEGRVVTLGACRPDRELTRYGRQPGPVAHGEVIETLLADQHPWETPWWLDLLLAGGCLLLGRLARFRGGPVVVALGALGLALGVSLLGTWAGLSGLVLGALAGGRLAGREA